MTGRFFGMFDKDMLSVIAPITGNFNTYGYVVIHMPIEQIVHGKDRILNIVYITALVIFILSLIILLVFTKTVIPVKEDHRGCEGKYAAGNLSHTIKVTSADEMGYLANTLNYMSSELNKMEEYQHSFIANVSPRLPLPADLDQRSTWRRSRTERSRRNFTTSTSVF